MPPLNASAGHPPVRLNDLPVLLAPYARTAPVFVYLLSGGVLQATRCRLRDEAELLLVLAPKGRVAGMTLSQ